MNHYFERYFRPKIYFDKPDDGGAGGNKAPNVDWPEDVLKGFRSLISREGDEQKAAMKLYDENYEHRRRIRELEAEKEKLNILSDEEFKQYQEFQSVLKDNEIEKPEDLKANLENAGKTRQELAKIKKDQERSTVAKILGWNTDVLNRLSDDDTEYESKTRKNAEGEDEQYVVAKKDGKETEVTEDWAKQEFGEAFLPSLKVEASNGATETKGKQFPSQKSSSSSSADDGDDPVDALINQNKKDRGIKAEE